MAIIGTYDVLTMKQALEIRKRPPSFLLDMMLGGRADYAIKSEKVLMDIVKGGSQMAPFVNPVIGGKVMAQEGRQTQEYVPADIRPRGIITAQQLMNREPGEDVISPNTQADRLASHKARIAGRFDDYISRREEWMMAQLLTTGKIRMIGDGIDEEIDFGHDNELEVSGTDYWDLDTAEPFNQLDALSLDTAEKSGVTPSVAVMDRDAMYAFINNAQIVDWTDKQKMNLIEVGAGTKVRGARKFGTIPFLGLDLWVYVGNYADDDTQVLTPMLPSGTVLLLPSEGDIPEAQMLYGGWLEMEDKQWYAGPRIPRNWVNKDKNIELFEIVSRPMPMIPNIDCWGRMLVLTPEG